MKIFCLNCNTYFPTGDACPTCGWQRPRLHTPAPPGHPLWQARAPGSAAANLRLTALDDAPLLLAGWGFLPRRADARRMAASSPSTCTTATFCGKPPWAYPWKAARL